MGTGFVRVPDGELHFEAAGDGPPVLLVHAGMFDCRMWDDQFELLAARHRVIRYDARSHGRSSSAAGDFRPDDDLVAVLDALDVSAAVLVGASMGGRIALDAALGHPDRVAGLCLVATGASGMAFVDPYILRCYEEAGRAREDGDAAAAVEALVRAWVDGPRRQPGEVDPQVRVRCADMIAHTLSVHAAAQGDAVERGAVERFADITAPTVLMIGDVDSTDIERVTATAAAQIPGADLVRVAGAGHIVNLEQPEAFNNTLTVVLEQISRSR